MEKAIIIFIEFLVYSVFKCALVKSELYITVEEEVQVYETTEAVLSCKVNNLQSSDRIAWYMGEDIISERDSKDRYKIQKGAYNQINQKLYDLVVSNCSRKDRHLRFTCRVLRDGYVVVQQSKEVRIKINEVPLWTYPYFYPKCPKLMNGLRIGEEYRVACETELTDPPVRLVLRKGSKVVCNKTASENTVCSHRDIVKIQDDGVKFTCEQISSVSKENKYPKEINRTCTLGTLTVLKKPNVNITGDTKAVKGTEVILICDPDDAISCEWSYHKDKSEMHTVEDKAGYVCILRIIVYETSNIDELTINCVAHNDIGSGSNSKVIYFIQPTSQTAPVVNRGTTSPKSPLWTGVIIAITGCFAIVIVLITSVILYCGWRHFLPVYSQAGVPSQEIYSEQYNRSPYRMQSVQKCVAIQVSDEVNECADDVEKKLTTETTKQDEQHYSHICSP